MLLNKVVSVLATWWPPAPVGVGRTKSSRNPHSPVLHHSLKTKGETQTKKALTEKRRIAAYVPPPPPLFFTTKLLTTLTTGITFRENCCVRWYSAPQPARAHDRCCVHLPRKVRDKDRKGEEKSTVADSYRSHQRHPLFLPPTPPPPAFFPLSSWL